MPATTAASPSISWKRETKGRMEETRLITSRSDLVSPKKGREKKGHTGVVVEELAPVVPEDQEHGAVYGGELEFRGWSQEQPPYLHTIAIKKAMRNEA
jgi:hypothetical protein